MSIDLEKKITIEERENLLIYIDEYIDEMSFDDRHDILSVLKMNIDRSKFKQKGDGTQIICKDISNDLLIWIYNRIYSKINSS